jgi:transcriptional regulator with XRE-family HTH domain
MKKNIKKHIKSIRLKSLPEKMLQVLKATRLKHGWSQAELGLRVGLPQMHISGIERGKITPRFDTLLDLVRTLDYDLLLVPRSFVPLVQSLIRQQDNRTEERPLYVGDEDLEEPGTKYDEF